MTYNPKDSYGYFVGYDGSTWCGGTFLYTIVPGLIGEDPIIIVGVPWNVDHTVPEAMYNTSDREMSPQYTLHHVCSELIWNTGKLNQFAEVELESWTESIMSPELLARFTPLVRQLATNLHEYRGADSTWRYDRHRNKG